MKLYNVNKGKYGFSVSGNTHNDKVELKIEVPNTMTVDEIDNLMFDTIWDIKEHYVPLLKQFTQVTTKAGK
jgi:hypothetical protein